MYKYGQGYWVRMMTAVLAGVMFLSAGAWSWGQLEKVRIPIPRWVLPLDGISGTLTPGQVVTLKRSVENQVTVLGTGVVESYTTEGAKRASATIGTLVLTDGSNALDTSQIELPSPAPATPPVYLAHVTRAIGVPLFHRVYLQAGIGAIILLAGAILIYWLVGIKPVTVDFLIATDAEMKKINWSTKKVIRDSTYVVIGAAMLLVAVIYIADAVLLRLFMAIGILGGS